MRTVTIKSFSNEMIIDATTQFDCTTILRNPFFPKDDSLNEMYNCINKYNEFFNKIMRNQNIMRNETSMLKKIYNAYKNGSIDLFSDDDSSTPHTIVIRNWLERVLPNEEYVHAFSKLSPEDHHSQFFHVSFNKGSINVYEEKDYDIRVFSVTASSNDGTMHKDPSVYVKDRYASIESVGKIILEMELILN